MHLLPKELSRPKRTGPEEVIPVPSDAFPEFATPAHLFPDRKFGWVQIVSILAHVAVIALLLVPILPNFHAPQKVKGKGTITIIAPLLEEFLLLIQ